MASTIRINRKYEVCERDYDTGTLAMIIEDLRKKNRALEERLAAKPVAEKLPRDDLPWAWMNESGAML